MGSLLRKGISVKEGRLCPGVGFSVQEGGLCPWGSLSRGFLCPGSSLSGRPPHSNVRVVRILLEGILVHIVNISEFYWPWRNDYGDGYFIHCV